MPDHAFDRRQFMKGIGAGAAALALPGALRAFETGAEKPNFIVLFTDDQGYQDVGCFGSPDIKTPNLDRMAAEGMKFTDFYSAAPVCTPSRAALLTGCYAPRVGLPRVLFPTDVIGLNESEVTIAEILKQQGYATCCVGKWHLGHRKEFLPTRHGFDEYFGIPYSNDMGPNPLAEHFPPLPIIEGEEITETDPDLSQLTRRYTERALRFIEKNKDRPFFLYLPHTMPHTPLAASERFKGKSARGLYGDVIEEIDWSVGEILKALKKHGLDERTLVIFTSDNGPWLQRKEHGGSALPLRAGKGTTYEGGMRVPCIMRWPGEVPAGGSCREVAATIDVLPTLAALAGAEAPKDRIIDGKDIRPLLAGRPGAESPHEAYFYCAGKGVQAMRCGKWKLRVTRPRAETQPAEPIHELYDLKADVGEKNNLADDNPEVVKRLKGLMDALAEDLKTNARPPGRVEPAASD